MNVVWLKRDLRLADHAPLAEACARGDVLVLYVVEPELVAQAETDSSHVKFAAESLGELREGIRARGGELVICHGKLPDVFEEIHRQRPIRALFSHEETGNGLTYARDKRVAAWCAAHAIPWTEFPQTGVVRRLRNRDGWAAAWKARMMTRLVKTPDVIPSVRLPRFEPGVIPDERVLDLSPSRKTEAQRGGESHARATLASFFEGRGAGYATALSSPVSGWDGCSRISPYLAFGNVSMRQVVHASALKRRRLERDISPEARQWRTSLTAFDARLHWHCHFMQKLEDEPRIEYENLSHAMDGLREQAHREDHFEAWATGRTGYPMIDACMRALLATGWVNFRMRAMLMSFAAYDLWLHWRPTGLHLARQFLDFEAGIHWSQAQMQAGTTGINTLRIYSPTKQLMDHDPQGTFVRQWVPELAPIPNAYLAEPWKMPPLEQRATGFFVGETYPAPIVDHNAAVAEAKRRLGPARRSTGAREEAAQILVKHGSRKRPPPRRRGPREAS